MVSSIKNLGDDYWSKLEITSQDIQRLTSDLFDVEKPMQLEELTRSLIAHRIKEFNDKLEKTMQEQGAPYRPAEQYSQGDKVLFPLAGWKSAEVKAVREGNNPEYANFQVMTVEFEDGKVSDFAANLTTHALNEAEYFSSTDPETEEAQVVETHGADLRAKLRAALDDQSEIVRIGYTWFPRALLVDISQGHLNIAEALLDAQNGGPMSDKELLDQLEIKTADNRQLMEFSLNFALQEDPRFEEVGTTGTFSWFLKRLEPKEVLEVPFPLRVHNPLPLPEDLDEATLRMFAELEDEHSGIPHEEAGPTGPNITASVSLIYPHWRLGSLPISAGTSKVFPSALESEHVKIKFIDANTKEEISAWVVRPYKYVIGLRDWYLSQNLIPGSIVEIKTTKDPGTLMISAQKKRSNKEWIKTVLVGADGGIVLALLRQAVYAGFSDRMAIALPSPTALDAIWEARAAKTPALKSDVNRMMNEVAKLNNQRHVHFVELYAAINLIRRVPPQDLLAALNDIPEIRHVGDHYYNMAEPA